MTATLRTLTFTALLASQSITAAGNWPQFRGPGAAGVSDAPGLPDTWNPSRNVAWKVGIPGRAWSSPVVWGKRIFLTTAVSAGDEEQVKKGLYLGGDRQRPSQNPHRWLVLCIDWESGAVAWEREVHAGKPDTPIHIKNSYASETPCTDGSAVYAYIGNVGLFAFSMDGAPLWSRKWKSVRTQHHWGTAASPVLHADRIYIVNDNEEESFIEAIDKRTGRTVWRVPRDAKSNWSTPLVWENSVRTEIVASATGTIRSYGLDGSLLWELSGTSDITIPTPFAGHGMVYVSSGFVMSRRKPIYAIRPGASGDITLDDGATTGKHIAWCRPDAAPYNPSPLLYGDQVYVLLDRGQLASYDARTGATVYEPQRIHRSAREFTASPWAYDGKVFCLSEGGDTFVLQAGPEFKLLHVNPLEELCMATPAIAGDSLLLRTLSHLYRIRTAPAP